MENELNIDLLCKVLGQILSDKYNCNIEVIHTPYEESEDKPA